MERIGRLHSAYGFVTSAFEVFLATELTRGAHSREAEEQDMIARPFPIDTVLSMVSDGTLMDAQTVSALGLLLLEGKISQS